jgi:hypothetical protein
MDSSSRIGNISAAREGLLGKIVAVDSSIVVAV